MGPVFASRSHFDWQLRSRKLELGRRTLIMGILNVTPDSFSDGGRWHDATGAVARGLELLDLWADILDVGGESTRPDAVALDAAAEQVRVMPVVRGILAARPNAVLSIDTYHAETARSAVEAGVEIVNDVSGHLWDGEMSRACAELGCGVVLMHTRGRPSEWRELPGLAADEVVPMVVAELRERTVAAMAAGVRGEAIAVDPGFGFGKAGAENFSLLAGMGELRELKYPVVAGISRKGFLRRAVADAGLRSDRGEDALVEEATSAANVAAVLGGAHVLRVHDVGRGLVAAAVADRILGCGGSAGAQQDAMLGRRKVEC